MVLWPMQENFPISDFPFVHRLIKIMGSAIKANKEEVFLGKRIDSDLTFKNI